MKGKNYSPSFPSSGAEEATLPQHGTDSAAMLILLPFPCAVQGKRLLLLNLELAVPRAKDELVVQVENHLFHLTCLQSVSCPYIFWEVSQLLFYCSTALQILKHPALSYSKNSHDAFALEHFSKVC